MSFSNLMNKQTPTIGNITRGLIAAAFLTVSPAALFAQDSSDDVEALQIAAVEALIAAPPERALPLARKVVEGNYNNEMKERALFVLSQIQQPEAQEIILQVVRDGSGELRNEAVRMMGISGNPEALAQLRTLYAEGDEELREAVLEAYIIANDEDSVFELATQTTDEEALSQLVEALGIMGAHDKLRQLRGQLSIGGEEVSEALIEAYAIAGDFESLREMAMDTSNPDQQIKAMEGLGIVGSSEADATLLEIYRGSNNEEVREAAIEGLMISGNDEALLELYRSSTDPAEKRRLLELLVHLDSEGIWEVIDRALEGGL